jgi:predicted MFS family arabinose efflux permease
VSLAPPARPAGPLANATYRRLLGAQAIALTGTGLTSVALALLAYDLAGRHAGAVVGVALALKMSVYTFGAPVITELAAKLPRRRLLVTLDLLRAATVVGMLLATQVWQVYVLIVLVNACSAGFSPTFDATIPDVLVDERAYTRALSFARLAEELEGIVSPALAAALLAVMSYRGLFAANGVAFLCSAALVLSTTLPARRQRSPETSRWERITFGTRRFLSDPRLRGVLALKLTIAMGSATVIVNTVVYVRDALGRPARDVAWALGAAGVGAMLSALAVPRLLERICDRSAMLAGGALVVAGLALAVPIGGFGWLLADWLLMGAGFSLVLTPANRVVNRCGSPEERPSLFAANFSLSHGAWLVAYPLAGLLGAGIGLPATAAVLAVLAAVALLVAALAWRE